jgi:glycosyltransferase involved in cell wall biosynthesis
MVLLTHPFGNANVRALLDALYRNDLLARFVTTIAWSEESYPELTAKIRGVLRRNYVLPASKIDIHPLREAVRLLASRFGVTKLVAHETGWASIDQVWQSVDRETARRLRRGKFPDVQVVYAYEDCAENIFLAARDLGLRRVYDLPIAYWETAQRLLREEAQRYPDWEPTLGATRDSPKKLARKTREVELAEVVVCPSAFVLESLPAQIRETKKCFVAPFGTPAGELSDERLSAETADRPLRILFAGALTQRKGLADLFAAMKMLDSKVELVVMGSLIRPLNWYRQRLRNFVYEPPRPHAAVLQLMQSCDVFVLPSIVEGRALVQQEAMACRLPVVATRNAGAEDLIINGETGFLIPIRSPEAIAEKISWCASNRSRTSGMGIAAWRRASEFSWEGYGDKIVAALRALCNE